MTAFPASPATPGQSESRRAYARLSEFQDKPWFDDYLTLRDEMNEEGKPRWDNWRKCVFIAWTSLPEKQRWPQTQHELAKQVLGLSDDRVIRKWRAADPGIDDRIARLTSETLFRHRANVFDALIRVASTADHLSHSDRKLFLEMTGDYKPRTAITNELSGSLKVSGDLKTILEMDEDQLDILIANLQATIGAGTAGQMAAPTE